MSYLVFVAPEALHLFVRYLFDLIVEHLYTEKVRHLCLLRMGLEQMETHLFTTHVRHTHVRDDQVR